MPELPANLRIETVERPAEGEVAIVRNGLSRFNRSNIPDDGYLPISVFVRNHHGKILGGAVCATYWQVFSIEMLWVDESLRGMGIGRQLMLDAEAAARRHNCRFMHVDTMSFQARGFYEKLGFQLFGALTGYPNGMERYYLQKFLTD